MKPKDKVLYMCPMSKILPIIRPVGEACNLRCFYCYYNSIDQKFSKESVMPYSVLEKFISEYLSIFDGEVTFLWHGGEPLLAGIEFYEAALYYEAKYAHKTHSIINEIQTNGTLINKEWSSFF